MTKSHSPTRGQFKWVPTEGLIYGTVLRAFLPLKKCPELTLRSNYADLYPGDEVYVVEQTEDGKWCRGYVSNDLMPIDFMSIMGTVSDKLPTQKIQLLIFPRKFVHLEFDKRLKDVDFLRFPTRADYEAENRNANLPSLYEITNVSKESKVKRPPYPFFIANGYSFNREILLNLFTLTKHIYLLYSYGEFEVVDQMVELYHQLDAVRIQLEYNFMTSTERTTILRTAIALITKVPKFISAHVATKRIGSAHKKNLDPSGFEYILTRDEGTGRLLTADVSAQSMAMRTSLSAMTTNYPVANTNDLKIKPDPNTKFDSFPPSHIIVDCHEILGSLIPKENCESLTAHIYLRTAKEVLTEPFIIDLKQSNQNTLDGVSAALFSNLPYNIGDNSRVYLVVEITESVKIEVDKNPNHKFTKPFLPFNSVPETTIKTIRRGVVAGATDISRVFSKAKGSLASGHAYRFKVELFASFYSSPKTSSAAAPPMDLTDPAKLAKLLKSKSSASLENNGWGDLIDRIINDSQAGIAVSPRVESILVSVKEIKGDYHFLQTTSDDSMAITNINSISYDTLSLNQPDRIYLKLGKVTLCGLENERTNISNITIQISSNNEGISFRPGSVDEKHKKWAFITVRPGELVNESIRIDGIEAMGKEETLRVSAYLNGYLLAKSRFYVKKGHQILEYKNKSVFQLISSSNKPLIEIEIGTKYVGKNYNMDRVVYSLLSLLRKYQITDTDFEQKAIEIFKALKMVPLKQITKYFNAILLTLLELLYYIFHTHSSKSSAILKSTAFSSLVQFLDMNIARHDQCKHLFNDFLEEIEKDNSKMFPELGPILVKLMSEQFSNSSNNWSYVGRALCRSYILILRLGRLLSKDIVDYHEAVDGFFDSVCIFFQVTNDSVLVDQVTILESYDLAINESAVIFDDTHLIQLCTNILRTCQEKEESIYFSQDNLSTKESSFVNSKYLLIRRLIQTCHLSTFFEKENEDEASVQFLSQVLEWSFKPFLKEKNELPDLTTASYANGVIITIIEIAKGDAFKRNLIRLLPIFCRVFLFLRKSCEKQDLFRFRRVFTPLFPTMSPLTEITVDSMVTKEVFIGVLIETATIIIAITKIVEENYGSTGSFIKIIEECHDDMHFQSPFYIKTIVREDLVNILGTVQRLLKGDFFPSAKWHTFTVSIIRASLTIIELCLDVFKAHYLPNAKTTLQTFDSELWGKYLKLCLCLATHRSINITQLSPLPRKSVFILGDDLIERAAVIVEDIWDSLGNDCTNTEIELNYGISRSSVYQMTFLSASLQIVSEFCVFAFLRHVSARRIGSKIIWAVLVLVWMSERSLRAALEQFTPFFFTAYQKGILCPSFLEVDTFLESLMYTIHIQPNSDFHHPVVEYVHFLKEFLTSMAETGDIPIGAEFDDDRTANQLEIFGYLMSMKRPEMLHTLVNDLFINHMRRKDYIQAALSLELLALTYEWNPNDVLPASKYPPLPEQSSFERREYLYKEAARNFTKGLKLEKALTVYKDLADAYDKINYDLDGLSFVHGQISNIYTDLQNVDRLVPSYFKVTFFGFSFPKNLRGKTFIFEGLPFEHITSVHNRLQKLYPGSKLVHTFTEADKLLMSPPNGKYIHVISVEPRLQISDEYATSDKKNDTNNKVRLYIENRDLRTFSSSRRVPGTNGITDLWVIEYIFETRSTFPTLMNRSEVVKTREKRLSPIHNAIKSLQQKIQELSGLEDMCYKLTKENGDCSEVFAELSRNITGTIDSPINGGIAEYRLFYQDETAKSKLASSDIELLMAAFNELTLILNRCLALHGQLCPPSLSKSHVLLKELFLKNFEHEIKACGLDINQTNEEVIAHMKAIQSSQQSFSKRSSLLVPRSLLSSSNSIRSSGSNGSTTRNSLQELTTTYSHRTVKSTAASHSTRISRPTTHASLLRSTR